MLIIISITLMNYIMLCVKDNWSLNSHEQNVPLAYLIQIKS